MVGSRLVRPPPDADVTLVFCTCKRLDMFMRTVESVLENLSDFGRLRSVFIVDDNSDPEDRSRMRSAFPDYLPIFKGPSDTGHARSLNMMLARVETPYLLYWEDDCVLTTAGPWLSMARDVILSSPDILSVSLDPSIENDEQCSQRRFWTYKPNPHAHLLSKPRSIERYVSARCFSYERDQWPGFSLKPNLLSLTLAKERLGKFDESNVDHMEYDFGLRALRAGLHTAILEGPVIQDIGAEESAYVLNRQVRSYDRDPSAAGARPGPREGK